MRLRIPQKEGKTLAMLEARARIYSRAYKDGAVEMEVEVPESVARKVKEWVAEKSTQHSPLSIQPIQLTSDHKTLLA